MSSSNPQDNPASKAALRDLLRMIVADRTLHAQWLNTLSCMEHVGATKIARSQSGAAATFMTLKHTAEEARHAFYLKKLAHKVDSEACPDYHRDHLLAATRSRQYLKRLDVQCSRLARNAGLSGRELRDLAYLLVTYAIEVRADALYPVYQEFLEDYPVKLSMRTIINEEEGHLEEMESALSRYPQELRALIPQALAVEDELFQDWIAGLQAELHSVETSSEIA